MFALSDTLKDITPKRLLCVFPHPDDESFATGALLIMAKKLGFHTGVLSLTKGEYGKSKIAKGDKLAMAREAEFKAATKTLGIDSAQVLEFRDGYLKEDLLKLEAEIKRQLAKHRPGIVATYDHGGFTGHPDHIAVSVATLRACQELRIPLLFYTPGGMTLRAVRHNSTKYNSEAQYIVRSFFNFKKANAFFAHKSQRHFKTPLHNLSRYLFLMFASETYHLVDFKQKYHFKFLPFKLD